ncbi:MAG TPA: response regulator [Coleofasciculaceae cyanobacterium]
MYRILIVDDIDDNVVLLKTLLETEGYAVESAAGGWAALRQIKASRPDLILLDVMMPDMSGYEVIERIRSKQDLSTIPIVLVTAYTDISREEGLKMGANHFIRKPIDADKLLACVKALCSEIKAGEVESADKTHAN